MEDNNMAVFKSYLRKLLRDLKDLEEALPETDENEKAKELLERLLEDTQQDIEDN